MNLTSPEWVARLPDDGDPQPCEPTDPTPLTLQGLASLVLVVALLMAGALILA